MNVLKNFSVSGTLDVAGAVIFSSTLSVASVNLLPISQIASGGAITIGQNGDITLDSTSFSIGLFGGPGIASSGGTLLLGSANLTGGSVAGTILTTTGSGSGLTGVVPTSRTVNGNALSSNIVISTITGNAGTATALATPRQINTVNFDGTANITITAAAGTLTGPTLASGITASSLVSFGVSPSFNGSISGSISVTSLGNLQGGNGTASTPTYSVGGYGGIYSPGTGQVGITAGNTLIQTLTSSGASITGTFSASGNTTLSSQLILSGRADATIASDQNDWAPAGTTTASELFVDGGVADRNITGLAGGVAGRILGITNKGTTNSIVLKNGSASSTAANRFTLPNDVTLPANTAIELRYDGSNSVWRPWGRALANTAVTAGSYGSATQVGTFTVDVAGRLTAAANVTITAAAGSIIGTTLSSSVTACSLTSFGASIALGTPGSGILTNCTFPILNQNTTGNAATVTTNANLTGVVTSVGNATTITAGSVTNAMLANAAVVNLSGTNTGDQTITLTGDITGSGTGSFATTLATVNGNVGSFGSSTAIPVITLNAKGLATAISTVAVIAPAGTLSGGTLSSSVLASFLTSVGTLTGGATGAGFTIALSTSTITGTLPTANAPALTGDITKSAGSTTTTLATANSNVGTFGSISNVSSITVNAKGLVTAASNITLPPKIIGVTADAGASVLSTGVIKYIIIPFAGTITGWNTSADTTGSIQWKVTKIASGSTPPTSSIVASAPPLLSSAQFGSSSTLTGWTTTIAANDIIGVEITSVSSIHWANLQLTVTPT